MQKKILVAYTTNSGSTREVAEAVAGELGKDGAPVEMLRIEEVKDIGPYSAVVVGGPMILGWRRSAVKFLEKHQAALSSVPVAYFFTAMSLTRTVETHLNGVSLHIDPNLPNDPVNPAHLSLRERYATAENYLGPALKRASRIRPVSAAFFAGKVDYTRLKLPQLLFVMLVVGAQPCDRRNWQTIREWAAGLRTTFSNGNL